jgi:hypothetical protein
MTNLYCDICYSELLKLKFKTISDSQLSIAVIQLWLWINMSTMYENVGMWQLCGWGRVNICMTFHMRAFDFFFISTIAH